MTYYHIQHVLLCKVIITYNMCSLTKRSQRKSPQITRSDRLLQISKNQSHPNRSFFSGSSAVILLSSRWISNHPNRSRSENQRKSSGVKITRFNRFLAMIWRCFHRTRWFYWQVFIGIKSPDPIAVKRGDAMVFSLNSFNTFYFTCSCHV